MWEIVVIVICLFCNAALAATELAFVAMNKTWLKKLVAKGEKGADCILQMRENPEKTLSMLQLGITFVGVIAAAVGGAGTDQWLTPWLQETLGVSKVGGQVISILIFVVPYTFLSVVISELLPKSLALRNPKWVIFHAYRWVTFIGVLLAPFVYVLEKSTKFCAKFFFSWISSDEGEFDELTKVGKHLRPYLYNLAKMEEKKLIDVMIPWKETDTIPKESVAEEVKKIVFETKHTRLPVVENEKPIGILQTKEFMAFLEKNDPNWQSILLPLIKIHEKESVISALKTMQNAHSHMSIIFRDEIPIGMVTIEDILEEVIGEIHDEDETSAG